MSMRARLFSLLVSFHVWATGGRDRHYHYHYSGRRGPVTKLQQPRNLARDVGMFEYSPKVELPGPLATQITHRL